MAGLGRRTHYRKHLTDSVLHDLPEPNPPQSRIGKIIATRGSNQFDVLLANSDRQRELAILPTKFRKLVWLKRNDYVIVETAEEETNDGANKNETAQGSSSGGIRCMISHILYQDQIKHLISKGLWPQGDNEFVVDDRKLNEAKQPEESSDGIVYDDAYLPKGDGSDKYGSENDEYDVSPSDDPLLFVNTNRLARLTVQDSSSSSDEED
jgi:probable RNA-binding protein EIF1AD